MIKAEELTKMYQEGRGIQKISFQVDSGTAFGFLGPNGAGKTTTIRLLMGFLKPDSGFVTINDYNCWIEKNVVKKMVGYLPGELHFIESLTGIEFLDLIEGMHSDNLRIKENRLHLMDALELDPKILIRKMSKGMKQKLGIISALMLDANVLILDEPTSGLDPLMQKVFIDLILEEKRKGKTLFISSHQFTEIERTCDQVGIIREGTLLSVQSINELREAEYQTFEVEVESQKDVELLEQSQLDLFPIQDRSYVIRVAGDLDKLWLSLARVDVKRFRERTLEIEEAFMDFYR